MGIFRRILGIGGAKDKNQRLPTDYGLTEKNGGEYFYTSGARGRSGVAGAAVWACITRVTQRVAQARFRVVDEDGAEVVHPLNALLGSPSLEENRHTVQSYLAESLLTDGNAFLRKKGGRPYPTDLQILEPDLVRLVAGQGRRPGYSYTVTEPTPGRGSREQAVVPRAEMVHVKGPFYDPALGRSASPLRSAAPSITLYNQSTNSSVSFLQNASRYGMFLKSTTPFAEVNKSRDELIEMFKELFKGTGNAGRTVILPHGYEPLPAPSLKNEMLLADQLDWGVSEIARLFGVPLALVQHTKGQRPNLEELVDGLMRDGVAPVCAQISSAFTERLLTADDRAKKYRIEADVSRFADPTISGQADQMMKLSQTGIYTINELRKMRGHPPIPGGDAFPQVAGAPDSKDTVKSSGNAK